MNEDVIETAGPYRVRLEIDQNPENPRKQYDHLTHVITLSHPNYYDVDKNGGPLQNGWDRIKDREDALDVFTRWARVFHGAVVEYHSPMDGPNSIWYLTQKEIAEVTDPVKYIRGEIEEYRAWAEGEVYVYVIEKAVDWKRADNEDETMTTWETVESCGGYYGYKAAEEAAEEAFEPYKSEASKD